MFEYLLKATNPGDTNLEYAGQAHSDILSMRSRGCPSQECRFRTRVFAAGRQTRRNLVTRLARFLSAESLCPSDLRCAQETGRWHRPHHRENRFDRSSNRTRLRAARSLRRQRSKRLPELRAGSYSACRPLFPFPLSRQGKYYLRPHRSSGFISSRFQSRHAYQQRMAESRRAEVSRPPL